MGLYGIEATWGYMEYRLYGAIWNRGYMGLYGIEAIWGYVL